MAFKRVREYLSDTGENFHVVWWVVDQAPSRKFFGITDRLPKVADVFVAARFPPR